MGAEVVVCVHLKIWDSGSILVPDPMSFRKFNPQAHPSDMFQTNPTEISRTKLRIPRGRSILLLSFEFFLSYLRGHWTVSVGTKAALGTGNGGGRDHLARGKGGGDEAEDLQGKEANKGLADDSPA